jgi:hypothetical protein
MVTQDDILALIISDNPHPFQIIKESVTLSPPVADFSINGNTKITVNSVPGFGYYGSVDVFYHRITLPELGEIQLLSETQFTPETIVSMINAKKRVDLTSLDLDLDSVIVPSMSVGDMKTVVLATKLDSLGWTGETDVSLLYGLPGNVNLLHEIVTEIFPSDGYFP